MNQSSGLLVSVRCLAEAREAFAGGADLIDVKEPDHGPLGCASDVTIAQIAQEFGSQVPISAALGELTNWDGSLPSAPLAYVKWGLANCGRGFPWQRVLQPFVSAEEPQGVVVAYADWQCACAPPLDEVCKFAWSRAGGVLLIDTYCKDADTLINERQPTLLDWISLDEILSICDKSRAAGCRLALAGSLGASEIRQLAPGRPAWFAVRGAACDEGKRAGNINRERVRRLVKLVQASARPCN